MQRIRVQQKTRKTRMDQYAVLAFDPRDPDVVRAKDAMRRHPSNASRTTAHGA
ncbi:MAG TPA: hypothetical protein VEN82_08265 [Actinomycetota bacterium]|nr:hypothetical protein [Actinomycetota bacterium]